MSLAEVLEKGALIERGGCLPSQEIRQRVLAGKINTHTKDFRLYASQDVPEHLTDWTGQFQDRTLENRIQPASFEPTLGEEMFELIGNEGVLLHDPNSTIWRRIKCLPASARPKRSILEPTVLLPGHAYLVPQIEEFMVSEDEDIRMSPKSTSGRAFLHERMVADYHAVFNTISRHVRPNELIKTWLLIEPTFWPVVVQAGLNLTQLRFFKGYDAKLNDREILALHNEQPLVYNVNDHGELEPGRAIVNQGLILHNEGKGVLTHGVIGLRARPSSDPLDLTKVGVHHPEQWFDFLLAQYRANIKPDDHMLLSSSEYLVFPAEISGEVDRYSTDTIEGELDDAGFFDPGFRGQGVQEVRSKERRDRPLKHGDDLTKMQLFRMMAVPDKIYGQAGNNYQGQVGPRVGKQFKPIDYHLVSKEYKNIEKIVITQDANILSQQRRAAEGFEIINAQEAREYERHLSFGIPQTRYECERDTEVLQIIPYCIIFGPKNTVFVYDRSSNPQEYTDWRLFDKRSIGVGGHITPADGPNYLRNCIQRELDEEVEFHGKIRAPQWLGTLRMTNTEVDTVHFGYVIGIHTSDNVSPREESIKNGRLVPYRDLIAEFCEKRHDPAWLSRTESWSQELIPQLAFLAKHKGPSIKL